MDESLQYRILPSSVAKYRSNCEVFTLPRVREEGEGQIYKHREVRKTRYLDIVFERTYAIDLLCPPGFGLGLGVKAMAWLCRVASMPNRLWTQSLHHDEALLRPKSTMDNPAKSTMQIP